MNISESLKIAIKCIKANWMRSLLTMLGIIIGVGSVIMIVSAGTGARDYIVSLIEDMGSNAVLVSVDTTQATDNDYITLDDVANIKKKVSGVDRCSPMMMGFAKSTIDVNEKEATVMMIGVNSDAQFVLPDGTKYGRFFTDEEYNAASPVAIIGTESAKLAFGYEDATGQYLTLSSSGSAMKVKVAGVADIDSLVNSMGGADIHNGRRRHPHRSAQTSASVGADCLYFAAHSKSVCTIRSAERPSQRSGMPQCFHLPSTMRAISSPSSTGSSPTSTLEPTFTVSMCSV